MGGQWLAQVYDTNIGYQIAEGNTEVRPLRLIEYSKTKDVWAQLGLQVRLSTD